ncbi:sensor histidine kinase [Microlunatus ginsengisoli]|uniref:histidine kinase n=1 Tax=Microlunatus ginsengisoli TaxID=363863 RepID=A0ABP6ZUL2_9ACTN
MPGADFRRVLPIDAALGVAVGSLAWASTRWQQWWDDGRPRGGPPMRMGGGPPFRRPDPNLVSTAWSLPWLIGVGIAVLVVGLALRRVFPRSAYLAVVAGTTAFLAAGGPYGPALLAPALAVLALADRLPLRAWLPWLAALPVMMSAGFWRQPYGGLLDAAVLPAALFGSAAVILPALFLVLRRSRRDAEAREREAERDRYVYAERMRIAREVHDVVGHSLSVINLQAGVALHVLDRRPEQVAASLEAIRSSSKDALAELRQTLDMFREDGPEPTAPQAGLDRLGDLVAAVRAAGRNVDVRTDGDIGTGGDIRAGGDIGAELPAAVDHAAYRIVQEALTNVVRHAADAPASIDIARRDDRLLITVSDHGPVVRPEKLLSGNGIRGMQERAAAVGGRVDVRPRPGGGVEVSAVLPAVTMPVDA